MKRLLIPAAVVCLALAAWTDASAQRAKPDPNKDKKAEARKKLFRALLNRHLKGPRTTTYVGPGYGYGYGHGYGGHGDGHNYGNYGGWHGYHHASTVGESHARGWAAMTEAQGRYNRDTAEAMVIAEEARSRAMDNWRKGIDTYFDGREANREYRASEQGPRISEEALRRLAKDAIPKRLSPSEMNAVTGEIAWPILLQDHYFTDLRLEMEGLFGRHALTRGLSGDEFRHVQEVTGTMLKRLKEFVETAKPMDYTDALQFIESLAYEARLSFNAANRAG